MVKPAKVKKSKPVPQSEQFTAKGFLEHHLQDRINNLQAPWTRLDEVRLPLDEARGVIPPALLDHLTSVWSHPTQPEHRVEHEAFWGLLYDMLEGGDLRERAIMLWESALSARSVVGPLGQSRTAAIGAPFRYGRLLASEPQTLLQLQIVTTMWRRESNGEAQIDPAFYSHPAVEAIRRITAKRQAHIMGHVDVVLFFRHVCREWSIFSLCKLLPQLRETLQTVLPTSAHQYLFPRNGVKNVDASRFGFECGDYRDTLAQWDIIRARLMTMHLASVRETDRFATESALYYDNMHYAD